MQKLESKIQKLKEKNKDEKMKIEDMVNKLAVVEAVKEKEKQRYESKGMVMGRILVRS